MEKSLYNEEAIKKLQKLSEEVNICMFLTKADNREEGCRPMATMKVDDDATIWFFTNDKSSKVDELMKDDEVHLVYSHPGKDSYINLWGTGEVLYDREKIKELWNPMLKAWFPDGIDDPNLCIIKVTPTEAYYWSSDGNKMIEFFKMAASIVTGKRLLDADEGKLSLN